MTRSISTAPKSSNQKIRESKKQAKKHLANAGGADGAVDGDGPSEHKLSKTIQNKAISLSTKQRSPASLILNLTLLLLR
jgi:hypothetical protein